MPIDKSKLTREILEKAAQCETSNELIALAKSEGMELTKAEADAYLEELENAELDETALEKVAGGEITTQGLSKAVYGKKGSGTNK